MKINIFILIVLLLSFNKINAQTKPTYHLVFDKLDIRSQTADDVIFNGNQRQIERLFAYYQICTIMSKQQYFLDGYAPKFLTFNKNQYTVVPLSSLYQQYAVKTVTNFEVDLRGKNFDAGIAYLESFDFYIVELLPALGVAHIHKVYCNNSEE